MAGPERDAVRIQVTRDLGLYDIVMLGLGTMVGAGVFVLVGSAARVAGVATILGIGMAAFVVALNALAYAELAGSRPDVAGGGYGWVREALPPPSGFLSGWFSWAGHLAAAALCAAGIGLFLDYALDGASVSFLGLPRNLVVGGIPFNASEKALALIAFLVFATAGIVEFGPPRRGDRPRDPPRRRHLLCLVPGVRDNRAGRGPGEVAPPDDSPRDLRGPRPGDAPVPRLLRRRARERPNKSPRVRDRLGVPRPRPASGPRARARRRPLRDLNRRTLCDPRDPPVRDRNPRDGVLPSFEPPGGGRCELCDGAGPCAPRCSRHSPRKDSNAARRDRSGGRGIRV